MRIAKILFLGAGLAAAQTTVYGVGGLNFVPGGLSEEGGRFGGTLGGTTQDSPLWEVSLHGKFLDDRLEVSVSNLWRLVASDSSGWKPGKTSVFPVVPSARWILDQEVRGIQTWGYSAGFSMPYGAFASAGWRLRLPWLSPEIDMGLGTPLRTVSVFGGLALDVCDGSARVLPLRLSADASLSGATQTLGRPDEAFWSVGVSTRLGRNLTFEVVHRRDRTYTAPAPDRRPDGVSFLRLSWSIDPEPRTAGASR
jgi:hypothetical protein